MKLEEVWEQFGFLTQYKSKDDFIKDNEQVGKLIDEMNEKEKVELAKAAKDLLASLDVGYTFEERLKRQYKVKFLLKQTQKTEAEFLEEAQKQLKTPKIA